MADRGAKGVRFCLGLLLLYSGILKLLSGPGELVRAIEAYDLVGQRAGVMLAVVLPWLEILVGGCIALGVLLEGALLLSVLLFGVFLTAIASALARGREIGCGCFGDAWREESISQWTLLRAGAMFLLATGLVAHLFFHGRRGRTVEAPPASGLARHGNMGAIDRDTTNAVACPSQT